MEEKESIILNKKIVTFSILALVSLVLGISYAYFTAQGQSAEQTITTSDIEIDFTEGAELMSTTFLKPIKRDEVFAKAAKKTFTVENTGTEKMYMHISLEDMVIPEKLKRYDFVWSLYEGNKNVSNGTFADAGTSMEIAPYQVFEVGEEKSYSLYIWIDETGVDQSSMMAQTFNVTIQAQGEVYWTSPESDFTVTEEGVLTAYNGSDATVVIPPVVNGVTVTEIGSELLIETDIEKIKNVIIPNGVVTIEDSAFFGGSIEKVVIPNSVTSIGYNAFEMNELTNISIPNSIAHIKGMAFYDNSISSIMIPDGIVTIEDSVFAKNSISNVVIPKSIVNLDNRLFAGNISLITVQGKSSAPDTFTEGWDANGYDESTSTFINLAEVIYVP
ncbi:MAG: leucine-rich repeat domain-containing protein [Bacilli bacterium]|nr:leucine-rich repeat domain-containing protein [Bacilli bacterium]